jgi:hypothetical protein
MKPRQRSTKRQNNPVMQPPPGGKMERLKAFIPGAAFGILGVALQLSGFQSLRLAIVLFVVAIILFLLPLVPGSVNLMRRAGVHLHVKFGLIGVLATLGSLLVVIGRAGWGLLHAVLSITHGPLNSRTPTITPAQAAQEIVPTVHDLYEKDFPSLVNLTYHTQLNSVAEGTKVDIDVKISHDFASNSKFMSVYIPPSRSTFDVCASLPKLYANFLAEAAAQESVGTMDPAEPLPRRSENLTFTGMIYLYYEDELSLAQLANLEELYRTNHLSVQFRGQQYATTRWLQLRPTATQSPSQ